MKHETDPPDMAAGQDQPEIDDLQAELEMFCEIYAEGIIDPKGQGRQTLTRHTQVLDSLFRKIMENRFLKAHKFSKAEQIGANEALWLTLALKVQKQCTETIKTLSTVDYMDNLTPDGAQPKILNTPSPPPSKSANRLKDHEKL